MPLSIIRNDITKMNVDVIVNAANTDLKAGGGVCGAIFNAAGVKKLQKVCDKHAPIKTGEIILTKGYSLPAKYIVHAVGPIYSDGKHDEEVLLKACYNNALNLARKYGCTSIAFPLISSGVYGYPKEEALTVATSTISMWLMKYDMDVSLVVYDKTSFTLSNELLGSVRSFIDQNYIDERDFEYNNTQRSLWTDSLATLDIDDAAPRRVADLTEKLRSENSIDVDSTIATHSPTQSQSPPMFLMRTESIVGAQKGHQPKRKKHLDDMVGRLDEPFSETLFRLIDIKGKNDVEVYKRANLDRKLFSKIRSGKGYMPSKKTAVALAIALELSLNETRDLLERAGFALSRSVIFDVIIEYFISIKRYDIFEINNVLFEYDQQLLGG